MIYVLLQIAAIAAVAVILLRWNAKTRRQKVQTWESIVSRLRAEMTAGEVSDFLETAPHGTPEEKWRRVHGAQGLCAMFQNARVMMEMAEYAYRNSETVDRELIATLRRDAMEIRVRVSLALTQYAFSQVNEGICANATRAAAMYTDMTERMAELLQVNAGQALPACVAAM